MFFKGFFEVGKIMMTHDVFNDCDAALSTYVQVVFFFFGIIPRSEVGAKGLHLFHWFQKTSTKVMSILWPAEDMPWTESGLTPDILFNPHGTLVDSV